MGNNDSIHVRCGPSGRWYYRIESGDNGQVLATSQVYINRGTAISMAAALRNRHCVDVDGQRRFTFDLEIDGA